MRRLQTRPQFQAALAGPIIAKTAHFALHRASLDAPLADETYSRPLFPKQEVWLGALVPKRWAKRAVTRNLIKRQIYTVSPGFLSQAPHAAFVVRLRREFSRQTFVSASSDALKHAVCAELLALMQT